jgi:hypothetical protein
LTRWFLLLLLVPVALVGWALTGMDIKAGDHVLTTAWGPTEWELLTTRKPYGHEGIASAGTSGPTYFGDLVWLTAGGNTYTITLLHRVNSPIPVTAARP